MFSQQIRLKEVYETPTKIHLILELVTGGELFDRFVTELIALIR